MMPTGRRVFAARTVTAAMPRYSRSRRTRPAAIFACRSRPRICGSSAAAAIRKRPCTWSRGYTPRRGPRTSSGRARLWPAASVTGPPRTTFCRSATASSPVFLDHQVKTCGACHAEHLETYLAERARPGPDEAGPDGDRGLRRLPRAHRHLPGHGHAFHAAPHARRRHLRQVPSLHRGAAGGERTRPRGGRSGRSGRAGRPRRQRQATAQLHFLPPGARPVGPRNGRLSPRQIAQPLRQLPRQPLQPLRHEHPRPTDRAGLQSRPPSAPIATAPHDILAGFRSAFAASPRRTGPQTCRTVPRRTPTANFREASIRTPTTPTPDANPLVHGVYVVLLDAPVLDVRLLRAARAVVVYSRAGRGA